MGFFAWGEFFSYFYGFAVALFFCGETLTYLEYATSFALFLRLIFSSKSETSNRVAVSSVFWVLRVREVFSILAVIAVTLLFWRGNSYVCLIRCELPRFFASTL